MQSIQYTHVQIYTNRYNQGTKHQCHDADIWSKRGLSGFGTERGTLVFLPCTVPVLGSTACSKLDRTAYLEFASARQLSQSLTFLAWLSHYARLINVSASVPLMTSWSSIAHPVTQQHAQSQVHNLRPQKGTD